MSKRTTRDYIIEAADQLFYKQGYERTSFADISNKLQISRGNFYYHFKTKDEILDAVIELRLADRQQMLDQWDTDSINPMDRILSFIHILIVNRTKIKRYGCPIGSLCTELAKLNHPSKEDANKLFTLFRRWLRKQFTLLGHSDEADELALHVLSHSQGVATLANAFRNDKFIRREVDEICEWLQSTIKSTNLKPN